MRTKQYFQEYRLGNVLRGFVVIKARTLKEAWAKGCRRFNCCFPTPSKSSGRMVYLEVLIPNTVTITTRFVLQQHKKVPARRIFANHEYPLQTSDYKTVAFGMSKQKLVFR